jgi:hypothetical protein
MNFNDLLNQPVTVNIPINPKEGGLKAYDLTEIYDRVKPIPVRGILSGAADLGLSATI